MQILAGSFAFLYSCSCSCPLQFSPQIFYWIEGGIAERRLCCHGTISVWILRYALGHCLAGKSTSRVSGLNLMVEATRLSAKIA